MPELPRAVDFRLKQRQRLNNGSRTIRRNFVAVYSVAKRLVISELVIVIEKKSAV
jgi:hypothetical protein